VVDSSEEDSSSEPDGLPDADEAASRGEDHENGRGDDSSEEDGDSDDDDGDDEEYEEDESSEEQEEDSDEWEPEPKKKLAFTPRLKTKSGTSSQPDSSKGSAKGLDGKVSKSKVATGSGKSGPAVKPVGSKVEGGKVKQKPLPPRAPPADTEANKESAQLLVAAERANLVRADRYPGYEYAKLHASKDLRQAASTHSLDVVKKPQSAARKPRYLLLLPGKFAPLDGNAAIGSIERLDTPNPEIYLDWPGKGKLRLRGTLLYPKNRYLALAPTKGELVCDEAFDNILVFSQAEWVRPTRAAARTVDEGEGEDAEVPLEPAVLPSALHTRLQKKWNYGAGAAADHSGSASSAPPPARSRGGGAGTGISTGSRGSAAAENTGQVAAAYESYPLVIDDDEGEGEDAGAELGEDALEAAAGSRPSRSFRERKRTSYIDDAHSDDDDDDNDSEVESLHGELARVKPGDRPPPQKSRAQSAGGAGGKARDLAAVKAQKAAPNKAPAKKPCKNGGGDSPISLSDDDDDDSMDEDTVQPSKTKKLSAKPQPKPKAATTKSKAVAKLPSKRKRKDSSDEGGDDSGSSYGGGSGGAGGGGGSAAACRARRASSSAKQSYAEEDDDDDDSDS